MERARMAAMWSLAVVVIAVWSLVAVEAICVFGSWD